MHPHGSITMARIGTFARRMPRLLSILTWLFDASPRAVDEATLFRDLCERLMQEGLPLWRAVMQFPVLHPLYLGHSLVWWRGQDCRFLPRRHGFEQTAEYLSSPYRATVESGTRLHVRLAAAADPGFPLLRELAAKGGTDILFELMPGTGRHTPGVSWASDRAGGFTPADLELLQRLSPFLGPPFELRAQRRTVAALLETYLGHGPGHEVLSGAVQRGDVRSIEAAIVMTDLRRFTSRSLALSPEALLAMLDGYFEDVVDAVTAEGGDVLKFMGDGVLAVIPVAPGRDAGRCLEAALVVVSGALTAVQRRNRGIEDPLEIAAGLDFGTVVYGNIGGPSRLDFTVLGPAVNRASRVLACAKQMGEPILATDAFLGQDRFALRAKGNHTLVGITNPVPLYAPGGITG